MLTKKVFKRLIKQIDLEQCKGGFVLSCDLMDSINENKLLIYWFTACNIAYTKFPKAPDFDGDDYFEFKLNTFIEYVEKSHELI